MATWNPEQVSSRTATVPTYQQADSATAFSQILNNGANAMLIVRNAAAAINLTFQIQRTVDGEDVDDKVITVPVGTSSAPEIRIIGPFPPDIYYNEDNEVRFTVSRINNANAVLAAIAV